KPDRLARWVEPWSTMATRFCQHLENYSVPSTTDTTSRLLTCDLFPGNAGILHRLGFGIASPGIECQTMSPLNSMTEARRSSYWEPRRQVETRFNLLVSVLVSLGPVKMHRSLQLAAFHKNARARSKP